MKRTVVILILLITLGFSLFGQASDLYVSEGIYYLVFSGKSQEEADEVGIILDAYITFLNDFLHFDLASFEVKLRLRLLADRSSFESYVSRYVTNLEDSFLYIQYSDPNRSELVGYLTEGVNTTLLHHSTIQFLKSFIPHPPLWIQKGLALYYEDSLYDAEKDSFSFTENRGWIPTMKKALDEDSLISLQDLLSISFDSASRNVNVFYAQSWGLVSFLIGSSNQKYNRILWDSIQVLSPDATQVKNENSIILGSFAWVNTSTLEDDYKVYLSNLKTLGDLLTEGAEYYSNEMLSEAESAFAQALSMEDTNPAAFYYLGLINYDRKEFALAEYFYQASLQNGGAPGIAYYALGVNAYADNRPSDAKDYLAKVLEMDPEGYGVQAGKLLEEISGITNEL
ncbi:MAG: hypothetical protein KAU17_02150 [Spirochaetales bacterium]|nr:hypothetical protein [Spirochaetales bacterium]